MKGKALREARKNLGLTQVEAAKRLGVSQAYFSLLENKKRKLTDRLARRAVRVLKLSPTALPLTADLTKVRPTKNELLVRELASLDYPGFSHVSRSRKYNPTTVLLRALSSDSLEARLVEALPWLLFRFSDLQWKELVNAAKVKDLQNRLGFLTSLARKLSEKAGDAEKTKEFERREKELKESRLMKEDTLCRQSMSSVEKHWLKQHRSSEAQHWNILSDLKLDHLSYAQ